MQNASEAGKGIEPADAFVGLGSNLGERAQYLRQAVAWLSQHPLIDIVGVSPVYETKAHTLRPDETAPGFLNAVVHLRTRLGPGELLLALHEVEQATGRSRTDALRWAPRTLDLDLLLYGGLSTRLPGLTVPHPRMGVRRFVLQPLADLAPDLYVPEPYDMSVHDLLDRCPDPDRPARTAFSLR